jgi:hypothetical protein
MTPQKFIPSSIPPDLADLDQWVVWGNDPDSGKAKCPFNAEKGYKASSTDPSTWTDCQTALNAAKTSDLYFGVGVVLYAQDPFCGIDLDDCLDSRQQPKPWAVEIFRRFGETYAEISPSGTGVKFWCRASIPSSRVFKYGDGQVEMYSQSRYFTVTGNRWKTSTSEILDCQATVDWLQALDPKKKNEPVRLPDQIPKGIQHKTLISYAASLWAKNLDADEVRELTISASKRCQEVPPEQHAINIANWIIQNRRRGHSEEVKAKLNGNSPRDYTFVGEEAEPHEADEPDEAPLDFVPWPEPLSEAAFHGPIGDLCKIIEPETEADIAAVLFQAIVMIGNVFGRGVHFMAEGTPHFCNEFVGIVGATAKGRKGSSFGQVKSVINSIAPEWASKRTKSGLTSGEGLIFHVRDEIREIKQQKGQMVEVVTDVGEADKRMLVVEEELSSAIKAMSREGNTLSGVLRQAWDSPMVLAPMTKNNRITASHPHVSIIGHITRDELLKNLKAVENTNGNTNRFLWCCAKRARLLPFGGKPNQAALAEVAQRIDFAVGWAQTVKQEITFDAEAAEMWSIVYEQLGDIPGGTVGAILSRAEPHVRRIAMIYAALDRSAMIKAEHLEAALEIWRYSAASVQWIFGGTDSGESVQSKTADKIAKFIDSKPEGCSRREIGHHLGGAIKAPEVEYHLSQMLSNGKIVVRKEARTRKAVDFYFRA